MSEENEMVQADSASVSREAMIEKGKPFAMAAHLGPLVGLPLFVIPFLMPDKNPFALVHARYAAATFVLSMMSSLIVGMLITVSCGLLFPLIFVLFLFFVPMIQGVIAAMNGTVDEPLGIGPIAKMIFGPDMDSLDEG